MSAGDLRGLHHAVCTLLQLFVLFKEEPLIPVSVWDAPETPVRGILLDLNPFGRVPKYDVTMQMVEVMADFKMNQLQGFIRVKLDENWSYSYSKGFVRQKPLKV